MQSILPDCLPVFKGPTCISNKRGGVKEEGKYGGKVWRKREGRGRKGKGKEGRSERERKVEFPLHALFISLVLV